MHVRLGSILIAGSWRDVDTRRKGDLRAAGIFASFREFTAARTGEAD